MRKNARCLTALLAVSTLALGVVPFAAQAFSYVMPTDAELLGKADGAVTGLVLEELEPSFVGGIGHRRYRLRIENALIGVPLDGEVVLRFPGSVSDGRVVTRVEGLPAIVPGDRVLVFHAGTGKAELAVMDLALGLFFQSEDDSGRKIYRRDLDGAESLGKTDRREFAWPRDAARFEAWIAQSGRGAANYWAIDAKGVPDAAAKFNLSRVPNTGAPLRWFEFDTDGSVVQWRAVAGGPAGVTAFSPPTAITAAAAAWSNDPNSRINLAYAGTVQLSERNTGNVIAWDDPDGVIPGPYNCSSGPLAVSQAVAPLSPLKRFDGTAYHTIRTVVGNSSTKIVVQDNVACHFNGASGQDGVEVIAHELGHTLGLAHSCGDTSVGTCVGTTSPQLALMRATVHRLGRGATLGVDDQAAVLRVYPDAAYVHPQEIQVDGVSAGAGLICGSTFGSSDASSSADGSVIVYQTTCTVPGKSGNGQPAIMVLDRKQCAKQLGAKAGDARCSEKQWARHTKAEPVSNGIEPSISADGRYVVFAAPVGLGGSIPLGDAALAAGTDKQVGGWAVYMQNLIGGATFQMGGPTGMANGVGTQPQVSPDGTSITFVATTLPETGGGGTQDPEPDVFQIKPVFGGDGNPTNPGTPVCASCKDGVGQPAANPTASANGGAVAYALGSSVWLRNMVTGATSQMAPPAGAGVVPAPSISYSGGAVAFNTAADLDDDGSDTNGKEDVYLYDTCCDKYTRVSKPDLELADPSAQLPSGQAVISGDGRRVAFVSKANNLMGYQPEENVHDSVFSYDVQQGQRRRYSRNSVGLQANGPSARPFLNYSGNMMLFDSAATNLDGADGNGAQDVFVRMNPQSEFTVLYAGFD